MNLNISYFSFQDDHDPDPGNASFATVDGRSVHGGGGSAYDPNAGICLTLFIRSLGRHFD